MQLRGVQAVIFDMDGVLLLANDLHAAAFRACLTPLGVDDFAYRDVAGMRTDEAFRKIFTARGQTVTETEIRRLVVQKQAAVLAVLEQHPPVAPGSRELLEQLTSRLKLALASSGSQQRIEVFLKTTGFNQFFTHVIDGAQVAAAKPAPDIYTLTAQALECVPETCLVIEDAVSGVQAAVAAGMRVVAVGDTDSSEALRAAGAQTYVADLRTIATMV